MNIGIITFHKAHNFGALLQALALQRVLADMGNEVHFVDYWPTYHSNEYKIFNPDFFNKLNLSGKIKYLIRTIQFYKAKRKKINNFQNFINRYIEPNCNQSSRSTYDYVVYGSDQIWRKMPMLGYKFDPFYFGLNGIHTNHHCSYAASMGIEDMTVSDKQFLHNSLKFFSYLNVREVSLKNVLASCGLNDNVTIGLDPTLLLTREEWMKLLSIKSLKKEEYVLFYDLIPGSLSFNSIKVYAKKNNLKIVVLTGSVSNIKYDGNNIEVYRTVDPVTFVEIVANANTVFTSSFHGLVFSIIFKRNFYASFKYNSSRARSILSQLDLDQRLLDTGDSIPEMKAIDYDKTNIILNELRNYSLGEIRKMLKG